MKRFFLSLVVTLMGTLGLFAQSDLVATLSHGSNIQEFYGMDALAEAYTAATTSDVITLSAGVFNAVDIEKDITLRGVGMIPTEANGSMVTQIANDMTVTLPEGTATKLTFEGINFLNRVYFYGESQTVFNVTKCRFNEYVGALGVNMQALHCVFAGELRSGTSVYWEEWRNTTLHCMNSVLLRANPQGYIKPDENSYVCKIIAENSIIAPIYYNGSPNCQYTNCIILGAQGWSNYQLEATCVADHCLGIRHYSDDDHFAQINNPSNILIGEGYDDVYVLVFKTFRRGENNLQETYELTDEAAATYLGDDGTQVGIYGGSMPFTPTPSIPQVKKFVVKSTTDNGKLKVNIDVE